MTTENASNVQIHSLIARYGSTVNGRRRLCSRFADFANREYHAAMNFFDRFISALPGMSEAFATRSIVHPSSPGGQLWHRFCTQDDGAMLRDTVNSVIDRLQSNHIYYPALSFELHSRLALGLTLTNDWGSRAQRLWVCRSTDADGARCHELFARHYETVGCDHCSNSLFEWEMRSVYGDDLVCESCIDNDYTYLDRYGTYILSDNTRDAIDRDGTDCVIDADDSDFIYDDESSEYRHVDYVPRRSSRNVIGEYHSSKPHFRLLVDDWTTAHQRGMGIELEVEAQNGESPNDRAALIHHAVNGSIYGHRVFFERDGSLRNGFEIISQPMSLPAIRETFAFLKDNMLTANLRSHLTSTCGLHIHVGRNNLSQTAIAKMVVFVNDPANDAFITALARRYNADFCRISEKNLSTAHLPGNRYEAINLTGRHTIEFRIFKGTLKYEAVVAAAEFVHALVEFCNRPNTRIKSLHVKAFMRFCRAQLREDTAILRRYLKERNIGRFGVGEAA